ncbi:MAG: alpha/beta fold hydrolase [Leptospirales bacterium]|nr:alpha/beta fold hydrolase [Leptospirales bacterium]
MDLDQSTRRRRIAGASALLAFAAVAAFALLYNPLAYQKPTLPAPQDFEAFLQERLAESRRVGVRPGNEERLQRYSAGRSREAILYIHGFGASRAEGEEIVDQVAAERRANTYYMRLPGHGASMEEHARHGFRDYLDAVEEAFAAMPLLGERTILVGSSTGALLAMYLAAQYPDRVKALIINSPLIDYRNKLAAILGVPGGIYIAHALYGEVRDAGWGDDPERRRVDGYEDHWLVRQRYEAAVELDKLRRSLAAPKTYGRIVAPTLMLYYYEDEDHQDGTVAVSSMLEAFAQFGKFSRPSPLNRAAAISDSNHIMLSHYVRTNKTDALQEIRAFLADLESQERGAAP